MSALISTSGSIDDVAGFCRVSARTVHDWKAQRLITFFQEGRNVWFHESDVVAFELKRRRQSDGERAGEAEELVRKEWREFLGFSQKATKLDDLERRVSALEARFENKFRDDGDVVLTNQERKAA